MNTRPTPNYTGTRAPTARARTARYALGVLLAVVALVSACDGDDAAGRAPAAQPGAPESVSRQEGRGSDTDETAGESRPHSVVARSVARDVSGGIRPAGSIRVGDLVTTAPMRWGDALAVGTADGQIHAYELPDAAAFAGGPSTRLWSQRLDGAVHGLAVDAGSLYAAAGDTIARLSPVTGDIIWSSERDAPVSTALTLTPSAIYAGLESGTIVSLEVNAGTERWSRSVSGRPLDRLAVVDGLVFVGTEDGAVHAIDAVTGEPSWAHRSDRAMVGGPALGDGRVAVVAVDGRVTVLAPSGAVLDEWSADAAPVLVSPVWRDGALVLVDGEGVVSAWSIDGTPLWEHRLTAHLAGVPSRVGDVLIVGEASGGAVSLDLRNGEEVSRVALGSAPRGEAAFLDGVLYLALADGSVRALGVDEERSAVPLFTSEGSWVLPESGTFRLRDSTVALRMRSERDAVFEISVSSAPAEDLVLEVVSDDGATVATNMGKVALSGTVRVALDAGISYDLAITRPDAGGEVTVSIRTEQLQ